MSAAQSQPPLPHTPLAAVAATPDSSSGADPAQSPLPTGIQGDLELELIGLANALYNLGTTVVNDLTKERDRLQQNAKPGEPPPPPPVKPVGQRVNDVVGHLASIENMAERLDTMIPMQILQEIDNARNPMFLTKDRIERAATENQFMNGKIKAIESYRSMLNTALSEHFPEISPYLEEDTVDQQVPHPSTSNINVKPEPDVKPEF